MTCNRKQGALAAQTHTNNNNEQAFSREKLVDLAVPTSLAVSLWVIPLHQCPVSPMEAALTEDEVSTNIASAVVVSLCAKEQRRRKSGLRASGANRHECWSHLQTTWSDASVPWPSPDQSVAQ